MMLVENTVRASAVHGMGVFTQYAIAKGTQVWLHHHSFDRYFTHQELAAFPDFVQRYLAIYAWSSRHNPHGVYYDLDNGRFMNHSATPNLIPPPNGNDFELFAAHDIAANEELTCDYRRFEPDFCI
jgi:SET domain-containing protein